MFKKSEKLLFNQLKFYRSYGSKTKFKGSSKRSDKKIGTEQLIRRYWNNDEEISQVKESFVKYNDKQSKFNSSIEESYSKSSKNYSKELSKNLINEQDSRNYTFEAAVKEFGTNKFIKRLVLSLGIEEATFNKNVGPFIDWVLQGKCTTFMHNNNFNSDRFTSDRKLIQAFLKYVEPILNSAENQRYSYLKDLCKIKDPIHWFPLARRIKRKIIMHVGPTNSGKTYRALERLKRSSNGIYCGPLRLLAYEVFRRFVDEGIRCNLTTGEEVISAEDHISQKKQIDIDSPEMEEYFKNPVEVGSLKQRLVSATIEMLRLDKMVDVAVFDEIQLIGDQQRGWGWLRAVIGVQAKEIHLCGEPTAIPIIESICKETKDELEIHYYERLSPLNVDDSSLMGSYKNIKKGDCLVSFSRQSIFLHKKNIEKETGLKCAVVYGKLPSENRAEQARLFNEPNSGYDVMVASDAVGMGLNLNIQRVIFDTLSKFNGINIQKIPIPQVKQIAGRAGRFRTQFSDGKVTTFHKNDIPYLHQCMKAPPRDLKKIGIQPDQYMLKMFSYQFPNDSLAEVLIKYIILAEYPTNYFLCFTQDHIKIAVILSEFKLGPKELMIFLMAPIPIKDSYIARFLKKILALCTQNKMVMIDDVLELPQDKDDKSSSTLEMWESAHRAIGLYMWLSFRIPLLFADVEKALERKLFIEEKLNLILKSQTLKNNKDTKFFRPNK